MIAEGEFLLIRRMKQGDEDAFDSFVRRHYADILQYCAYHCRDQGDAEDLTQEVFVRFFAKLDEYHYRGRTKQYLYAIAGNLCKNYYKKQREIPVEDEIIAGRETVKDSHEEDVARRLALEQALRQLPPQLEQVIDLYYFQELKLREIAGVLNISLPLVKYRMRQAKKQLERLLEQEESEQ